MKKQKKQKKYFALLLCLTLVFSLCTNTGIKTQAATTKSYNFNNMTYQTSWGVTYSINSGKLDATFSGQYMEVKYTLPETLDMSKCTNVVFNAASTSGEIAFKLYDTSGEEVAVKYGFQSNGDCSITPSTAAQVNCIGIMALEEKEYSATVNSVTFTMNESNSGSDSNYESLFSSISLANGYKSLTNHNPCLTQRYGADPGVMEYNGRIYVYTTDDHYMYSNGSVTELNYGQINKLSCMSSADLVNWTDHGLINVAGSSGVAKWAGCSWAPTPCHKTINGKEKFFIYFANNANGIGVLTSDSPTGPWTDPIGKPLISRSTANCSDVTWLFDPAVLVDTDGTGYLYFGGGIPTGQDANPKTTRAVKLGNDMTSLASTPVTIDAPWFFEDSGINKIGDTYFYSYCTNWSSRPSSNVPGIAVVAYMTSKSPTGPFTYQGEVFQNPGRFFGITGNNHHTMVEFKNSFYIFYHSLWLNNQILGSNNGYRSTHVDKISSAGNGKIGTATGTLTGVTQVADLDPYVSNRMATMAWQGGIDVSGSGSSSTVNMNKGEWLGLSQVAFGTGAGSITMKAASKSGAVIKVCQGSAKGTAVGYIAIPATGSASTFTNVVASISNVTGTGSLFFVASGDCTIDSWQFSKTSVPTTTPTTTSTTTPTSTPTSTPTTTPTTTPTITPTVTPTATPIITPTVTPTSPTGAKPVVAVNTTNNGNSINQQYTVTAEGGTIDLSKLKIVFTADGMSTTEQSVFIDNAALNLNVSPFYSSLNSAVTGSIHNGNLTVTINNSTELVAGTGTFTIDLRFAKTDWGVYGTISNPVLSVYYNDVLVQ